jgi:capsular exopolysaccharide synthesis family protein
VNIIRSREVTKRTVEKLDLTQEILETDPETPALTEEEILELSKSPSLMDRIQEGGSYIRQLIAKIPRYLGAPQPYTFSEEAEQTIAKQQSGSHLPGALTLQQVEGTWLLDVSITHPNPELAAKVANALVDTYIEYRIESRVETSRNAVRWLVDETEAARQKLEESEAALQTYKEEHAIISFEDRQNISTQKLSDMNAAVNAARIQRLNLETQYRELQRFMQKKDATSIPQIISNQLIQGLRVKLMDLESEYAELLKKFREKHPNSIALKTQIDGVQQQLTMEIQRVLQSTENEYRLALAQEETLAAALEEQKREAIELNKKATMYQMLEKEIQSNQQIYNELLQRMKEASVTERLENTNVQIVERATIPTAPINTGRQRNLMVTMLIALALGIGAAFFMEYWNDKIVTPEDLKRHLELPLLALIPKVTTQHIARHEPKKAIDAMVATIVLTDPQSTIAEAYRGLRTQVTFSDLDAEERNNNRHSVLLITSSEPSEGKSSTTANLAITMAQSGQKTLVIDCDFRKPKISGMFHLKDDQFGFADVLMDFESNDGIGRAIYTTDIPNLHVLPCGTVPLNPSELLSLRKTGMIIHNLQKQYNRILVDTPPVNVVTDALILSQHVDGVILIFRAGKVRREVAKRAKEQFVEVGTKVIGGVINNIDMKKARYHYYYYYAYHYPRYYRKEKTTSKEHNVPPPSLPSAQKVADGSLIKGTGKFM